MKKEHYKCSSLGTQGNCLAGLCKLQVNNSTSAEHMHGNDQARSSSFARNLKLLTITDMLAKEKGKLKYQHGHIVKL